MSGNYDVYTSRQKRARTKNTVNNNSYMKKLKKQLFFSALCLTFIYLTKISISDMGNSINNGIKKALDYQMNTSVIRSGVTTILDNIINTEKNLENGESTNEQPQTTAIFEDI